MIDVLKRYRRLNAKNASIFLFIFYAVGVLGFMVPASHNLFLELTKWALLLNIILLFLFHENRFTSKVIAIFILVFASTFFIELIGVNTGLIFGNYWYGNGLGIKLANTPLLIGMNWLMLSYSIFVLLNPLKLSAFLKSFIGATCMLVYDLILEQSAGMLNMWFWENNHIPLQNYIAWFLVALIIQLIFFGAKEKFKNKLALPTLICQGLFFIALGLLKLTAS